MSATIKITSASHHETIHIGRILGMIIKKGDVICLYGDLGAGKTTLIKGVATGFGIPEREITSASFTIISEYESEIPFYHIDLYRLNDLSSVEDLGIHEYLSDDGITVIEWAERLKGSIDCTVKIEIKYLNENIREIIIGGIDEKDWNNNQVDRERLS